MAALPSHLIVRLRLAGVVVPALHHVEHVALGVQLRHLALGVMGADDVQVVIEPHFHDVVVPMEPAGEVQRAGPVIQVFVRGISEVMELQLP